MNNFRTEINIKKSNYQITHNSKILTIGSCFSENIGNLLIKNKFNTEINPFGILYNPFSIKDCLDKIIENYLFKDDDLINYQEQWHSFFHHGKFSNYDKNILIEHIDNSLKNTHEFLKNTDYLLVTFGSAYVYQYIENNLIVSNCHKIPNKFFNQYMLELDLITSEWKTLINKLYHFNPKLKLIFTVSPIRYLKYGSEMNQISKSILLLLINNLKKNFPEIDYFPAYEIFMDDLRDYRFYKDDMIHPSEMAINYVWQKFSDKYFSHDTLKIIAEVNSINMAVNHRPRNINSVEHKNFLNNQLNKIALLKEKYNYINFESEEKYFLTGIAKTSN